MSRDSLDEWIDKALEADPLPMVEVDEPEHGPPLTDSELRCAQDHLSKWQAPPDFINATKALCERCLSKDWFRSPRLKFLHDAYVLADFVRLREVESVRLAGPSERWPDGFVKLSGQIHNVEVTSTHGGRKLGKEYREISGARLDSVNDWIARADSIPKHLYEVIRAKIEKKYSSPYWLVVYLNINEYGIRQCETEQVIAAIKARHSEEIEKLFVLWKDKLY